MKIPRSVHARPMVPMGLIAAAALAIAGCAQGVIVYAPVNQQLYADGDFESATLSGELRTEVYGSLFGQGGSGGPVAAATTRAMKGANRGKEVVFTPSPKGNGSGGYHVVMLFNPQRAVAPEEICAGADRLAAKPRRGSVYLLSGFCLHDTLLSTAGGRISGLSGPDDPAFRALVRQVTLSLFPAFDHIEPGDSAIPS